MGKLDIQRPPAAGGVSIQMAKNTPLPGTTYTRIFLPVIALLSRWSGSHTTLINPTGHRVRVRYR